MPPRLKSPHEFAAIGDMHRSAIFLACYDAIVNAIHAGHLKPGDTLSSEADLALQMDVRPGTIRLATSSLLAANYIVLNRGGQYTVAEFPGSFPQSTEDRETFLAVLAVRKAVDGQAALLTGLNCDPEKFKVVTEARDALRKAWASPGPETGIQEDANLHLSIIRASGLPFLEHVARSLAPFMVISAQRNRVVEARKKKGLGEVQIEHEAIYQLLSKAVGFKKGSPARRKKAEEAMRAAEHHLVAAERRYREFFHLPAA